MNENNWMGLDTAGPNFLDQIPDELFSQAQEESLVQSGFDFAYAARLFFLVSPSPVALHAPVFDPNGTVCDIELLRANPAWYRYRPTPPPEIGSLGTDTRFKFEELVPHLQACWGKPRGVHTQRLHIAEALSDPESPYRYPDSTFSADYQLLTHWIRIPANQGEDDIILEVCNDLDRAALDNYAEQDRQLEQLLIQRQKWLGDASHELRGPLNAAVMSLNVTTRRDDLPDGVLATLKTAERSLLQMSDLVRDMFDTAKLENDAFELSITPNVPVHEIVDEIVDEFASNHDVLSLRSVPDRTIEATLDRDRIRQVVRNLVSNAVKYHQTDKQATVAILLRRADDAHFEIVIDDTPNGLGMTKADLEALESSQPFWRADAAVAIASGTGLGVQLSRKLVERSGGELYYESEFGAGTIATVRLPYTLETTADDH